MLEEIKIKLREKIPSSIYSLWMEPIKEESYNNHILTIIVPNAYYTEKVKLYKSLMIELANEIFNESIEISLKIACQDPFSAEVTIEETETHLEQNNKTNTWNGNPNFKDLEEFNLFWQRPVKKLDEDIPHTQIKPMPNKYGKAKVVCFTSFSAAFFTHPKDKDKYYKVRLKFKFANGKNIEYDLYRGIEAFGRPPIGQLTTTHGKILLAIIHIWQEQGCLFAGTRENAIVNVSIRELAKKLNYKNISGYTFKWLYTKVKELACFPNLLSHDGKTGMSFTFLQNSRTWSDKKDYNKIMLELVFDSFVSKQLYCKKAILMNHECYRIIKPIAFKFLMHYNKKIYMSNNLELHLKEIIRELQINPKSRITDVAKTFKTAFAELDGYEFDEKYYLDVKLTKNEEKEYVVMANRYSKKQRIKIPKLRVIN
ncbi:hypothetical protein AGMMS50233_06020 [Endomicrobiia bacterium]|nr:hypothetical protein AGMMS50233_06020 [Endomicrobiia bacterium]